MPQNTGLSASAMAEKKKKKAAAKANKDTVLGGGAEKGNEVSTRASEGAATGTLISPGVGTVIGAAIGAGAGLAESNKNKKADAETTTRPRRRRLAHVRANANRRKDESVARTATLAQSVAKWQKDLR